MTVSINKNITENSSNGFKMAFMLVLIIGELKKLKEVLEHALFWCENTVERDSGASCLFSVMPHALLS